MKYRRSLRHDVILPVKGRILFRGEDNKWHHKSLEGNTSIENIGADGLFITSDTLIEEKTMLELAFYLMDTYRPVALQGIVMWKRERKKTAFGRYGYGVKFETIADEDRKKIIEMLLSEHQKKNAAVQKKRTR